MPVPSDERLRTAQRLEEKEAEEERKRRKKTRRIRGGNAGMQRKGVKIMGAGVRMKEGRMRDVMQGVGVEVQGHGDEEWELRQVGMRNASIGIQELEVPGHRDDGCKTK
jgi:hypothetical protein